MMSENRSPFPPTYFAQLADIEARNWWFRSRNRMLLWVLNRKIARFDSLLEVGCGTGYVLEGIRAAFPEVQLFGAEYHEEGLEFARARVASARFRQLDLTQMVDVDAYDVIGAFDVIEHIDDDRTCLANLARALKPGGTLLVSVPQHQWLWSATDESSCHVRRYSSEDLVNKLRTAGLRVDYKTSFVSLLLPLMYLSRRRVTNSPVDPIEELKPGRLTNFLLETVMALEMAMIKVGVRFAFGGSLLVVARKLG